MGIEQQILQAAARRARGRRRGAPARALGERRRSGAADSRDSRVPAERRVRRRGRLRPGARVAAASADEVRVRRQPAPVAARGQAARVADRLDDRDGRGRDRRVQAPQREGEGRARRALGRQAAGRRDGDRRGSVHVVRRAQGRLPGRRKEEGQVPPRGRRQAARGRGRAAGRHREVLPRQPAGVHDARAGARESHPDQERQGRRGGQGEGRGALETG